MAKFEPLMLSQEEWLSLTNINRTGSGRDLLRIECEAQGDRQEPGT